MGFFQQKNIFNAHVYNDFTAISFTVCSNSKCTCIEHKHVPDNYNNYNSQIWVYCPENKTNKLRL